MCELSFLNQKTSSLFKDLEKDVNNMKIQNRNQSLIFSMKTLRFYKMNKPKRMKSSNLLWKFTRQCLILYQRGEMTKLSQIINNNNNNLNNCWNTINKQCMNSTSSKCNKIHTLKKYNYRNNSSNSNNKVITVKKYSNNK